MTLRHRLNEEALNKIGEIGNYYERAVIERLARFSGDLDADELADAACLALNQLPSWYIRHSVDARFYLSQEKIVAIEEAIDRAVARAILRIRGER